MSFTGLLEENNNNYGSEQRNYADDAELVSLSVLRRLDKQFQDIMLAIHQVWGPKFVEMEGRIMKLDLAVNKLLASLTSNNEHDTRNSGQRCLSLQFNNKISSPIWTGDEIKGEEGKYIEVVLKDETGKEVDVGPEASAEVKIVAFKGDVDDNEGDATIIGYFADDVARERKAKKSIRAGEVRLKLKKGVEILANIKFRNSSSHMSGVFRLGALVVDRFDGTFIKDAKSESFIVKDYRGKYNGKHHPPSLSDDICHLDNIGRGSAMRLKEQKVNTVEDFLIQLLKDSDGLKHLVGLPAKKWAATVKHALTCQLDEKVYCSFNSEENKGVVLNVVGKVLGLILESKYIPFDKLSDEDKAEASKMEIAKFMQKDGLDAYDDEAHLLQQFSQPISALHTSNYSMSYNTIDHEDEVSEVGESSQRNLISSQDVASSSNFAGGTSVNFFDFEEDFHFLMDGLRAMDQNHDQQYIDMESLWLDFDNHQTASTSDMFVKSPVVSDDEVKKKLVLLFTASKWVLKFHRMAAFDGNENLKKRRISECTEQDSAGLAIAGSGVQKMY